MKNLSAWLSKPGVSKKIIPIAVGGILFLAITAFVLLIGDKNPAKMAKERQRAEEAEKIRTGEESRPEDARNKLAQMEKELLEARERERAAIEARMAAANKPLNKEEEAKRVAEALKIDLPRAPSANEAAGLNKGKDIPDPNTPAAQVVNAHMDTDPNKGALAISEFYDKSASDRVRTSSDSTQGGGAAPRQGGGQPGQPYSRNEQAAKVENGPAAKPIMPTKTITKNYMLSQGSVIRTVFVSGVNTQHPGEVIIRVTEDVYDSITGNNLLVPKGTRLVGKSAEVKTYNQDRHPLDFERMIFPDGRSIKLPRMPAVSRTGEAGAQGDYHSNLLPAIMPSVIAGIFGIALDYMVTKDTSENTSTTTTMTNGSTGAATQPGQTVARQVFPDITKRLGERYNGIKPYFTIDPGTPFIVQVNADIAIPPDDEVSIVGRKER